MCVYVCVCVCMLGGGGRFSSCHKLMNYKKNVFVRMMYDGMCDGMIV